MIETARAFEGSAGTLLAGGPTGPIVCAIAVAAGTLALLRLVRALPGSGLGDPSDAASDAERARKPQVRPVPRVGGIALGLGTAVGTALAGVPLVGGAFASAGLPEPGTLVAPISLVLAFAVGLLDDLLPRGLAPGRKLLGQALAGLPLGGTLGVELVAGAVPPGLELSAGLALGALASAVALNAINTFDNADGAAVGVASLGLLFGAPAAAGGLLGFLPFNLLVRSPRGGSGARAYLGDSGSHLLGMLVLLTPLAWPVLALPLFDLARLAVERVRRGRAPWLGDRRHLAHLLDARGVGPVAVVFLLAAIATPSVLLGLAGARALRWELVVAGLLATGAIYLAAFLAADRPGLGGGRARAVPTMPELPRRVEGRAGS